MNKSKGRRYLSSIAWFTVLWGVKEFVLEPIINQLQNEDKRTKQRIRNGKK